MTAGGEAGAGGLSRDEREGEGGRQEEGGGGIEPEDDKRLNSDSPRSSSEKDAAGVSEKGAAGVDVGVSFTLSNVGWSEILFSNSEDSDVT